MKIKITNEDTTLTMVSNKELRFEDLFKVYQLVTGNDDELEVSNTSQPSVHADESGSVTVNHLNPELNPNDGQIGYETLVKVAVACPLCGFVGVSQQMYGHKWMNCPRCHEKLFLSWSTGIKGEKDDKGFYLRAEKKFHSRFEPESEDFKLLEMMSPSSDSEVPDAYSTIPEIKDYLDENGIDYSHAKFKGDYVELIGKVGADRGV